MKSLHYNAKHHVYAYSIFDNSISKFSDDGEPSGTAGLPILKAIQSENVTNVMVIVVRYFGGILLGTNGLRKMYFSGAQNVLKISEKSKIMLCDEISVRLNYNKYSAFKKLIELNEGKILDTSFDSEINVVFCVPKENSDKTLSSLNKLLCGNSFINILGEKSIPI